MSLIRSLLLFSEFVIYLSLLILVLSVTKGNMLFLVPDKHHAVLLNLYSSLYNLVLTIVNIIHI